MIHRNNLEWVRCLHIRRELFNLKPDIPSLFYSRHTIPRIAVRFGTNLSSEIVTVPGGTCVPPIDAPLPNSYGSGVAHPSGVIPGSPDGQVQPDHRSWSPTVGRNTINHLYRLRSLERSWHLLMLLRRSTCLHPLPNMS